MPGRGSAVGLRSGRSPGRGSASTAVRHRRARRSRVRRPFPEGSPGQWPDLVAAVARKIACLFVLYLAVLSWSHSGLLDR